MATITTDFEIASSLPAPKLFKAFYHDFDSIAPKVYPKAFKSISVITGDGGAGTIKDINYGDDYGNMSVKLIIDVVDGSNFSYDYTFFEGSALLDIFEKVTHHIKIIPSGDGGCVYKHAIDVKFTPQAKNGEDHVNEIKESVKKLFKVFESYIIDHPN